LTPEQQELARKYIPLAYRLTRPMKVLWANMWADIESAALMALCEAAQSFDSTRNVKFATFARIRILGSLTDLQRRFAIIYQVDPLEKIPTIVSFTPDLEQCGKFLNTTCDREIGLDTESVDEVEKWLRKLPAKHAAACREIYVEGRSQIEASRVLGISKSHVSSLHREALEMLNEVASYRRAHQEKPLAKD
jgi:RNA polymerase sigma factor (sigma-70 family)